MNLSKPSADRIRTRVPYVPMRTTVLFRCILLATLAFLSFSCNKEDLPKPTQSGKNTMGALVNGKEWVASPCWGCTGSGSGKTASYVLDRLTISGQEVRGESNVSMYIHLTNIHSQGTYIANRIVVGTTSDGHGVSIGYRPDIETGTKNYYTSPEHTVTVTLTKFDQINKIVSGIFSGTLRNVMDHDDTITVTNGRFDLIFYTH